MRSVVENYFNAYWQYVYDDVVLITCTVVYDATFEMSIFLLKRAEKQKEKYEYYEIPGEEVCLQSENASEKKYKSKRRES